MSEPYRVSEPKMTDEYLVSTAILFSDGSAEGQVLHIGDQESCDRIKLLSAVIYNGSKSVLEAKIVVIPRSEDEPLTVGQFWLIESSKGGLNK